jgi:hypothetical protein
VKTYVWHLAWLFFITEADGVLCEVRAEEEEERDDYLSTNWAWLLSSPFRDVDYNLPKPVANIGRKLSVCCTKLGKAHSKHTVCVLLNAVMNLQSKDINRPNAPEALWTVCHYVLRSRWQGLPADKLNTKWTTVSFAHTKKLASLYWTWRSDLWWQCKHVMKAMAQKQPLWLSWIEICIIKSCFIVKLDGDFTTH